MPVFACLSCLSYPIIPDKMIAIAVFNKNEGISIISNLVLFVFALLSIELFSR
jgi:hypothetical protein